MPDYTFSLINHLGERFDTRTLLCRDDAHACECGRSLLALGYPVLICLNETVVQTLQPDMNEFNAWLRAFTAPVEAVLRAGRRRREP